MLDHALRESVEASIGTGDFLPLNSCIAASLPSQNPTYMPGKAVVNGVALPWLWALSFPLVLRISSLVDETDETLSLGIWQMLVGASLTALVLAAEVLHSASMRIALEVGVAWFIFGQRKDAFSESIIHAAHVVAVHLHRSLGSSWEGISP